MLKLMIERVTAFRRGYLLTRAEAFEACEIVAEGERQFSEDVCLGLRLSLCEANSKLRETQHDYAVLERQYQRSIVRHGREINVLRRALKRQGGRRG